MKKLTDAEEKDVADIVKEFSKTRQTQQALMYAVRVFMRVAEELVGYSEHLEMSSFKSLRRGTRPGKN